jgi:biopolymer transport protein ExbD
MVMNLRQTQSEEPRIDITPLIDVVFLLLIFFMVTTTFQQETRLKVDLPEALSGAPSVRQERIVLEVSAEGRYQLQGEAVVSSREALRAALAALGPAGERPLVLQADGKAPHDAVVRAMDAARLSGFDKLSIAAQSSRD